ncbi:MAG: cytochrome c oxidase cbb3-type subunit 1 [Pseudoalteromonas tetraodonis]|jgi:cytochrome c oxidase cbb3-type subunit 1
MASDTDTSSGQVKASDEGAKNRAAIDRSARLPVLFFFTSSALWLVIASVLGFIAAMKLHDPGFLDYDWAYFLNYGMVKPAFIGAFVYGWAFQAGLGVAVWIMARLCRTKISNPLTLIVAGHFWNIGVVLGVLSIFLGYATGMEWMQFPAFVWPLLLIAYSLVSVWVVLMFQRRRPGQVYISQWYLLAACFWFPWVYLTANVFIHVLPGSAVMSAAINSWYINNVIFMVLTPIGLASAYYFIPKILGRPVHSYQLSIVGFWGLAVLTGWSGMQKYLGGPLPTWMPAISGAATILMLVPVVTVAINHHLTTRGNHDLMQSSPTMLFTVVGAVAYTITAGVAALFCFVPIAKVTQFTHASYGFQILAVYAFFSMSMFGAMYFIVPRLVGGEWKSAKMIRFHFWFSTYGVFAIVALLMLGGLFQANGINHSWDEGFVYGVESSRGMMVGAAVGWACIFLSNLVFLFHLCLMVCRRQGAEADGPTLLQEPRHAAVVDITTDADAPTVADPAKA